MSICSFLIPARKEGDNIVPIHTLECPKNDVGGTYLLYDVDHPRYLNDQIPPQPTLKMNDDRYCYEKIWGGQVTTYFEIRVMTEGVYQLSESGTKVNIKPPKKLELDAQWTQLNRLLQGFQPLKEI